ncbi:MAG: hypothetical protein WAX04_05700 [Oscillospiraceae bacterium]
MLKKTLDQYKAKRQTVSSLDRQMDDICETFDRVSLEVLEYDDTTVRQLIDTIKVMSEDKLLIIFKGGFEMAQMM